MVANKEWWPQLTELQGERHALRRIKSDAAAARREFDISLDFFAVQCHLPCHYCGLTDMNNLSIKSRSKAGGYVVKNFRYNGLDRVDNSIGYTEENTVPCCAVCNRAKNSMSYDEFIDWINNLIEFRTQGEKNEPDLYNTPTYFQWGTSASGYATTITLTARGDLFVSGTRGGSDYTSIPLWGLDTQNESEEHYMHSEEEEPDEA